MLDILLCASNDNTLLRMILVVYKTWLKNKWHDVNAKRNRKKNQILSNCP